MQCNDMCFDVWMSVMLHDAIIIYESRRTLATSGPPTSPHDYLRVPWGVVLFRPTVNHRRIRDTPVPPTATSHSLWNAWRLNSIVRQHVPAVVY